MHNKWSLRDGRHGRGKTECPQCGRKKCFQRYWSDEIHGYHPNPLVGICDHKNSCGYHLSPKNSKKITGIMNTWTPPPRISFREFPIQRQCVSQILYSCKDATHSNFHQWLRTYFSDDAIDEVLVKYGIGATPDGGVSFPQIDTDGNIRTSKVMYYREDGHRNGDKFGTWLHTILMRKKMLPSGWEVEQCLFGEHLLRSANEQTKIGVVESEKSAVFLSLHPMFCNRIWIATGGCHNFRNLTKVVPLIDRKGVKRLSIIPDVGSFGKWEDEWRRSLCDRHYPNAFWEVLEGKGLEPNDDIVDVLTDAEKFRKVYPGVASDAPEECDEDTEGDTSADASPPPVVEERDTVAESRADRALVQFETLTPDDLPF